MKCFTLLFLLVSQIAYAQSNTVQSVLSQIDFRADTVESVFRWVADNIRYDVKKLNEYKKVPVSKLKNESSISPEERNIAAISEALKTKKGVCEEYAAVFDALIKALGYEAYVVEGYIKKPNGNIGRRIGHAWNAVKVNGEWKLYDVTWGAGYVIDGKRFQKEYKPEWYDVDPDEMIKRHMPFDPLWQLRKPVSYHTFDTNREIAPGDQDFVPEDLITAYLQQDKKAQMESQLLRSQEMGDGVNLLKKWRKNTKHNIENYGINSKVDDLNAANDRFSTGVKLFNGFITAQKKQFKGKKYSLAVNQANLEKAKKEVEAAMEVYNSVEVEDRKRKKMIDDAIRHGSKLLSEIDRGLAFVAKQK